MFVLDFGRIFCLHKTDRVNLLQKHFGFFFLFFSFGNLIFIFFKKPSGCISEQQCSIACAIISFYLLFSSFFICTKSIAEKYRFSSDLIVLHFSVCHCKLITLFIAQFLITSKFLCVYSAFFFVRRFSSKTYFQIFVFCSLFFQFHKWQHFFRVFANLLIFN